ncbi:hypothetical protein XGA_4718 [Xanthomonas hortorum ATCC 19865]|nr:hypothetical protein XGA_4718 [Xanthomonas hortorum ATCC 19865]
MVMWFSPEFARDRGLDETCLRHRAGQYTDHDALFPSILGLMQVKTSVYARDVCTMRRMNAVWKFPSRNR